jgi:hypothetical protein
MKDLDKMSFENWIEKEEEDLERGSYLLNFVREFGLDNFVNCHETDENGMILVNENGDVLREGN